MDEYEGFWVDGSGSGIEGWDGSWDGFGYGDGYGDGDGGSLPVSEYQYDVRCFDSRKKAVSVAIPLKKSKHFNNGI